MFHSLRFKIPAATIVLTLTSMTAVGILTWNAAIGAMIDTAHTKLRIIARAEATDLKERFRQAQIDLENLLANKSLTGNISDLIEDFDPGNAEFPIVRGSFSASPGRPDASSIEDTLKPTAYGRRHKRLHASLRQLLKRQGYADVLIIDDRGRIAYTVNKDHDFGRTIGDPSFAAPNGPAFFARLKAGSTPGPVFQDFGPYPVGSGPSAFLGAPILRLANVAMGTSQETVRVGYLVIRFTPALLDASAAFGNGLGASGDLLIVGDDGVLRAAPRHADWGGIGAPVLGSGSDSASDRGRFAFTSPAGRDALAVSEPVSIMGRPWTIRVMQSRAEALAPLNDLSITLNLIIATIGLLAALMALRLAHRFAGPLTLLTEALQGLARQERIGAIPGLERRDEIGAIARAVLRIRDVTAEHANATAELYRRLSEDNARLANSDALTGLLNRRGFFAGVAERGGPSAAKAARPAVLAMDLDGFKPINDRYGHPAGDRALVEVARRLRGVFPEDASIARLGGDEFAVYVAATTILDIRSAATAVLASMVPEIDLGDGLRVSAGISIGLFVPEDEDLDLHTMLERADTALYAAKQEKRGTWKQYAPPQDPRSSLFRSSGTEREASRPAPLTLTRQAV